MITSLFIAMVAVSSSVLCMQELLFVSPQQQAQESIAVIDVLCSAIKQGNRVKIKELLNNGFYIQGSFNSFSALSAACSKGNLEAVELLIDAGVDCNPAFIVPLWHGWSRHSQDRYYASDHYDADVTCVYTDILRLMYEKRVLVPSANKRQETEFLCHLMYYYAFCPKMAEYLLSLGAEGNLKTEEKGRTALEIAQETEREIASRICSEQCKKVSYTTPCMPPRPCSLVEVIERVKNKKKMQ